MSFFFHWYHFQLTEKQKYAIIQLPTIRKEARFVLRSKLHKKYYSILIFVAIVPMLIINLTTYNLLRKNIISEIEQRELETLRHTVEESEVELLNAETVSAQVISNFLNYHTSYYDIISMSYDDMKNMFNYNDTLLIYNEHVKSIYLYEEGAEHILVNNQFYMFEKFYDTAWLEYYKRNSPTTNGPLWIHSRRYNINSSDVVNCASYIRPISSVEYDKNGYVVINIDISKLYSKVMNSKTSNYFVYNDVGQMIYKNNALYDGVKLEDVMKDEIKIDGETYITFHHIAPINKFHYVSLVSQNELFASLKPLKVINISLVLLTAITLIIACIYFSKKLYTPFTDLSSLISSLDDSQASEDEFDFDSIKEYIQNTSSRVNALELKIDKDSNIINEHKIHKLLRGEFYNYNQSEIESIFNTSPKEFIVVVIENYVTGEISNDSGYYEHLLKNIIKHFEKYTCKYLTLDFGLIGILFYSDTSGKLSSCASDIRSHCIRIIKELENIGYKYISAGIGNTTGNIEEISKSLSEALLASKHRLYMPSRVSAYSDIEYGSDDICFSFISEHLQQFVQYIKERKLEKCQNLIDELCDAISKSQCTPDTVCSIFNFMRDRLFSIPKSIGYSNDEIFFHDYKKLYEHFNYNTSLEEYKNYFYEICRNIISGLNIKSSQKYKELSDSIKQYLIDHINEDISLSKVADTYGMSTSYLSTIFKRETGQNYVKFVTNLKMESAMQLIAENESMTFAEISEHVGYYNIRSFYNTFKKHTGLTPSEYKKQAKKF